MTWISAIAENSRLVFVLHEVLDVTHFVVYDNQVLHLHFGALFYPGH